jgi:hypothetical protein
MPTYRTRAEESGIDELRQMRLAVCGVIRAAPASSLAVNARPSINSTSIVVRAGSPTNDAMRRSG